MASSFVAGLKPACACLPRLRPLLPRLSFLSRLLPLLRPPAPACPSCQPLMRSLARCISHSFCSSMVIWLLSSSNASSA